MSEENNKETAKTAVDTAEAKEVKTVKKTKKVVKVTKNKEEKEALPNNDVVDAPKDEDVTELKTTKSEDIIVAVSYTHLTLPTILLV